MHISVNMQINEVDTQLMKVDNQEENGTSVKD